VATVGVGIDVVDVPRFEIVLGRRPRIVERLFTEGEQRDARGKAERLAARFAAKEAVMKSLSVGAGSVPWKSIEVKRAPSGAPSVMLHGAAAELATLRGADEFHISLTHTAMTAAAFVVASSKDSRAG
jgi:holo-[acyl-carrier protein] synthase